MIRTIQDDLNLKKIAASGQCFRWEVLSEAPEREAVRILHADHCVYITDLGDNRYEFSCDEEEFLDIWKDYLDLKLDYREVRGRIDPEKDKFLWEAAQAQQGIRILQQDPWEMLLTFIISQNKNIPAIRNSVYLLSEACGDRRTDCLGKEYYAFPSPSAVAALDEEQLKACKLGYRAKYVHAAAETVRDGKLDFEMLRTCDEPTTIRILTGLYGVGVKVANCVSLFGVHHIDAFPIDVWIKRILEEQYPQGYPYAEYAPYNGIYQQYMFAYYREMDARRELR